MDGAGTIDKLGSEEILFFKRKMYNPSECYLSICTLTVITSYRPVFIYRFTVSLYWSNVLNSATQFLKSISPCISRSHMFWQQRQSQRQKKLTVMKHWFNRSTLTTKHWEESKRYVTVILLDSSRVKGINDACYCFVSDKICIMQTPWVLMGSSVSVIHRAHSPDSMRRSIIWTSPTQAAAWSGVRRSWSYTARKKKKIRASCSYCKYRVVFMAPIFKNRTSVGIIRTSALTSSFLCNNNWTSSALRLKMAWTRGGYKTIKMKHMHFRYTVDNSFLFISHLTWWRRR